MTHTLKCWPEFYNDISKGVKTFDVRKNDRGFTVGDRLVLQEFDPEKRAYTGGEIERHVTYILPGGRFGIDCNFCVLGIK